MNLQHAGSKLASACARPVLLIPAFGLLVIVVMWAAVLERLAVDQQFIGQRAMDDTRKLAVVYEEQTLRALKAADRLALRVKHEFEAGRQIDLRQMAASGLLMLDDVDRVAIADASGTITGSTRPITGANIAVRAYFRRHQAQDTGALDISEPVKTRFSDEPIIVLSRRLQSADGNFAGVVAVSVHPDYFTRFYQQPQLGKNGLVAILNYDGLFRARRIGDQPVITADGRSSELYKRSLLTDAGSYRAVSLIDGADRLVAFRTLQGYPMVVAVGQAADEVFADFHGQRIVYLALTTAVTAAIMAFFSIVTVLLVRLKRREAEVIAQQRFLVTLVDNMPFAVQVKSVRDNYRIVIWNKAAEAMYGLPRAEAIGRTVHELWPKAEADRFHTADVELIASGGVQDFPDRPSPTRHRGVIRAHLRKVPLYDSGGTPTHLLAIHHDNTERLAAEEELRESEARFRSLLELSSDWYWEQDEQFRAIRRTGGEAAGALPAGKFYGLRRWEMSNATPVSGTWDDHKAMLTARLPFHDFEYHVMEDDGSLRYRAISGEPIFDAAGKFKGYRGIGRDITGEKLAEAELVRRNGELTELNHKLSQAQQQLLQSEKLASIGQLAAGVAHEINNPIGYVMSNFGTLDGYVSKLFEMLAAYEKAEVALESQARLAAMREQIELDYLKEDIPTLMKESKEGISRVRKIVADLKDFSRTDGNQEWAWTDLHNGIDSTLNIVSNEIKYKADVVKEYGVLPEIECMATQLNQVFLNLLVNAAQAVDKPRGRIVIRTGTQGDEVWVEVADDGTGMPPEVMSRIFDPFFTTKPVGQGTGLGLSLTYGIIQKHSGRIDLESEVGKGTTFRIWLPIRREAGDEAARVNTADAASSVESQAA